MWRRESSAPLGAQHSEWRLRGDRGCGINVFFSNPQRTFGNYRASARHCILHTHGALPLSVELCADFKAIGCQQDTLVQHEAHVDFPQRKQHMVVDHWLNKWTHIRPIHWLCLEWMNEWLGTSKLIQHVCNVLPILWVPLSSWGKITIKSKVKETKIIQKGNTQKNKKGNCVNC